ncbi:hypothetical protein [Phocaeicola sartorii]|uniref:hypothetical protein n=1 Tax=Phocaeicola sartorii TaxID=671267 RepID=UPI00258B22D8|nr:hypothetical protein [Phocaeicola sartorii]
MKTKFTMMMAVITTFAISLNLHSSNEEVVFGAPAVQMPRGGEGVYTVLTTKTLMIVYRHTMEPFVLTYQANVVLGQ